VKRLLILGTRAGIATAAIALAGCSSTMFAGDRVDYRSASVKVNPLEIPPDLTQLSRNTQYQAQRGTVTASSIAAGGTMTPVASNVASVAPMQVGDYRIERDGNRRWISLGKTCEQVWPAVVDFWQGLGFALEQKDEASGVIVTSWAENRAKLPQDMIRSTLGGLLDSVYSTGEMDQYRTRVERVPTGCEIFVTHRGMIEVYTTPQKDYTKWEPRPNDPELENEMLQRLLVRLGAAEAGAQAAVANPVSVAGGAPAAPRARVVTGQPAASLELDDPLDRAWRRVGSALDRSGFTVEDRDRAAGLYFVRYVDPKTAGQEVQQGFFSKLFGGSKDTSAAAVKYQVALKGEGTTKTLVSVLNSQGAPETGENGNRIVTRLAEELK
jgi:outer membrane protein assembly factor BamC